MKVSDDCCSSAAAVPALRAAGDGVAALGLHSTHPATAAAARGQAGHRAQRVGRRREDTRRGGAPHRDWLFWVNALLHAHVVLSCFVWTALAGRPLAHLMSAQNNGRRGYDVCQRGTPLRPVVKVLQLRFVLGCVLAWIERLPHASRPNVRSYCTHNRSLRKHP